ncbi:hypothetical protein [Guptibacillus hwajinpoensis]|uniref:hypothetical protein n=1 Tax=Guptibacillus hwajinpoensis TaxID=208199 RepID=UPI001CFC81B2|nr:hypothetical protein [Pseudalkalibacillus hwajinpoensis]WLR60920.1 hypothetical protein LC071_06205 [Pseudalkalibacillus hwajinpoensis]
MSSIRYETIFQKQLGNGTIIGIMDYLEGKLIRLNLNDEEPDLLNPELKEFFQQERMKVYPKQ